MYALKLAGLLCLITGGTGLGWTMGAQVAGRCRMLRELKRMAALLTGEISCAAAPLPEALAHAAVRLEGPLCVFLKELSEELVCSPPESLAAVFSRHVKEDLRGNCLMERDLESLRRMGEALGYLDREMQLRSLRLYEEELCLELEDACRSMPQKRKVYRTAGVMGGLFLAILLL